MIIFINFFFTRHYFTLAKAYIIVVVKKIIFILLFLAVFSVRPVWAERVATRPAMLRRLTVAELRVRIDGGTLTAKNGNTLTVTKDGVANSVLVDSNTQLRRKFWGKATIEEMSVGDSINVLGKWIDDSKSTVQARLVRDLSIQKRFGVFIGTVTSLSPFIIDTHRGAQTVTFLAATKFFNRKGETIRQAEILVGHRVRVRGLWDNKLNTITEVTQVKDYSLPLKPTPVATP